MSTAQVQVLHAVLTASGWLQPSTEKVQMGLAEAREHEARGYVDVLEVDGKPEVWGACCSGAHDHA